MQELKQELYLGSASPRRKELLSALGFQFKIITSDAEEIFPKEMDNDQVAIFLSEQKWDNIYPEINNAEAILITSDTVVVVDNKILGKPEDDIEAKQMLQSLSGKDHHVYTAVTVGSAVRRKTFNSGTKITFKELSENEIDFYISQYKPFDKAGAYGIQEWIGMIGIQKMEGSYFSVMGFPVDIVYRELIENWT